MVKDMLKIVNKKKTLIFNVHVNMLLHGMSFIIAPSVEYI